jgi:hypothetical protein
MTTPQPTQTAQPVVPPAPARPGTGLGVAALVLGVASLVAAVSFTLFPLGLLGGLAAAVLGVIAVTRTRTGGGATPGAVAGIVCGVLALTVGVVFAVHFGVFVARNTSVFTTFDSCIAKAGDRSAIVNCITHLANGIRP